MITKPEYIYIAFDLFPSYKGSSTHINHCLKALQKTYDTGLLICLGNEEMPTFQFDKERDLYVYRWKDKVINFLERTQEFQMRIAEILSLPLCEKVKIIHFRDVWGGIPAIKTASHIKKVFEINAFPSLELPNRYPNISQSVIKKIKNLERLCVLNSNVIITPSQTTKHYIISLFDVKKDKLIVIPNGVSIKRVNPLKKSNKKDYVLYFGALQKWQGIKTLFKAFKELQDLECRLMICSSVSEKRALDYKILAKSIGVDDKIDWFYELDKTSLATHINNALFTIAPLTSCDRNLVQGCNPLKIIESMAYGKSVIASDIPVVREIIENKKTGFLIPPDRPELLGRKIRELIEKPERANLVGERGRKLIKDKYLWSHQEEKMKLMYQNL